MKQSIQARIAAASAVALLFLLLSAGTVSAAESKAAAVPAAFTQLAGQEDIRAGLDTAKVIYLDFWASWCVPCRASFPWLNEMKQKYGDKLLIIGINEDEERSEAARFLEKTPAEFSIFYDTGNVLAEKFKVEGMPSAVILNSKGEEEYRYIGFSASKSDGYEEHLSELITSLSN